MKALTELALVLVLSGIGAVATWQITGPPDRSIRCDPAKISAEEVCLATVQKEWKNDVLWIDARSEADWKRDGLPGSIHLTTMGQISFDEQVTASMAAFSEALNHNRKAVVYCNGVGCSLSKEVARQLGSFGLLPDVKALHGGYDALKAAGLVKGSSPAN